MRRARKLSRLVVVGLALSVAASGIGNATAATGRERFAPNARDSRIALRAVLGADDFPVGSPWTSLGISLSDAHLDSCGQRVDDLVLTGYSLTNFARTETATKKNALLLISNADVFATRAMLAHYVARTLGKNALACLRARVLRRAHTSRFVSFKEVGMPRFAKWQRAFQVLLYPRSSTELWVQDVMFFARGRTLAVVAAVAPVSARHRLDELLYFRRIAERIPQ